MTVLSIAAFAAILVIAAIVALRASANRRFARALDVLHVDPVKLMILVDQEDGDGTEDFILECAQQQFDLMQIRGRRESINHIIACSEGSDREAFLEIVNLYWDDPDKYRGLVRFSLCERKDDRLEPDALLKRGKSLLLRKSAWNWHRDHDQLWEAVRVLFPK
jgi:hypothetical protein